MLTIDVEYGYNNTAKGGRVLPLTLWIDNREEEDFRGTLEILARQTEEEVYSYAFPLEVEGGGMSPFSCAVPLGTGADSLLIRILDEAGEESLSETVQLESEAAMPELFVGVLSDDPASLWYFDGVAVNYGQLRSRMITLYPESLPENRQELDMLDVIVVSSFRMSSLKESQTRALMQWMRGGGVLVLGTGARVDDTLGPFAPEFLDDMYGAPVMREVSLQNVQEAPGGRDVTVPVTELSLHGGSVVLASDGAGLISAANKGNGVLALASFDFNDFSGYAESHSGFADLCLSRILGSARLARLSSEAYGTENSEYWSAQALIDSGVPEAMPNLAFYGAALVSYLFLAGPLLYLFLKARGMQLLYRKAAAVLALLAAAAVYVSGSAARFRDTFLSYAVIRDVREDTVSETAYLNLRNPYNASYSVRIPGNYSVYPLTMPVSRDRVTPMKGDETASVTIWQGTGQGGGPKEISVRDAGAFSPRFFRLEENRPNADGAGFSGELSVFGDEYSGEIVNNFAFPVRNAAVVLYGKVIPLGDLDPGEVCDVTAHPLYHIPLNDSSTVAAFLCGVYDGSAERRERMKALERAGFLSFFLSQYTAGYTADARVVGFADQEGGEALPVAENLRHSGMTLLFSTVEVNSRKDDLIYRSAMQHIPEVLSGDYLSATNSFYRGEPVVLGYLLGPELVISSLRFEMPDTMFEASDPEQGASGFRGVISLYNYGTGNFDDLPAGRLEITAEELRHYLSPDNMITVRYADSASQAERALDTALPVLTVIGEER